MLKMKQKGVFASIFVLWVVLGATFAYVDDGTNKRHISYLANSRHTNVHQINGCRNKFTQKIFLLGPAKACSARKPIKLNKALKMEKELCAKDWQICSITDKAIQKLSWKALKMPDGCYAFDYGKSKAGGYGNHCQANLYFDGVLCCPKHGTKAAHHLHHKTTHKLLDNHPNSIYN